MVLLSIVIINEPLSAQSGSNTLTCATFAVFLQALSNGNENENGNGSICKHKISTNVGE